MLELNPQPNFNEREFNMTSYWQNVANVSTDLHNHSKDLAFEQEEIIPNHEIQEDNLAELWKNVGMIAVALKETRR